MIDPAHRLLRWLEGSTYLNDGRIYIECDEFEEFTESTNLYIDEEDDELDFPLLDFFQHLIGQINYNSNYPFFECSGGDIIESFDRYYNAAKKQLELDLEAKDEQQG